MHESVPADAAKKPVVAIFSSSFQSPVKIKQVHCLDLQLFNTAQGSFSVVASGGLGGSSA